MRRLLKLFASFTICFGSTGAPDIEFFLFFGRIWAKTHMNMNMVGGAHVTATLGPHFMSGKESGGEDEERVRYLYFACKHTQEYNRKFSRQTLRRKLRTQSNEAKKA